MFDRGTRVLLIFDRPIASLYQGSGMADRKDRVVRGKFSAATHGWISVFEAVSAEFGSAPDNEHCRRPMAGGQMVAFPTEHLVRVEQEG